MEIIYTAGEIMVRELEREDELKLAAWLSDPVLLQYYEGRDRPHDLQMIREAFYQNDDETRCMVEYCGKAIGYIQFYLLDEESRGEYGYPTSGVIYGMDQFIGETDYWDRGIGGKLVTSMLEYLVCQNGADKVVMDPQAWNIRAIRCYEKCGFRRVKLLKAHEWHEGQYRDCWLMEYPHP